MCSCDWIRPGRKEILTVIGSSWVMQLRPLLADGRFCTKYRLSMPEPQVPYMTSFCGSKKETLTVIGPVITDATSAGWLRRLTGHNRNWCVNLYVRDDQIGKKTEWLTRLWPLLAGVRHCTKDRRQITGIGAWLSMPKGPNLSRQIISNREATQCNQVIGYDHNGGTNFG